MQAFDKVPYQRFLNQLNSHGIGGNFLLWIQSWPTGKRQNVRLNEFSDCCDVLCGVPQGLV